MRTVEITSLEIAFWSIFHATIDVHCSACGDDTSCVRVVDIGPAQWICCTKHKIRKEVASGLLSAWMEEDPEQWSQRQKMLDGFTDAEIYAPNDLSVPEHIRAQMNDELSRQAAEENADSAAAGEVAHFEAAFSPYSPISPSSISQLPRPILTGTVSEAVVGQAGDRIAVWCPYCARLHQHGWTAGNITPEHRIAHCDDGSPFRFGGYWIMPASVNNDHAVFQPYESVVSREIRPYIPEIV